MKPKKIRPASDEKLERAENRRQRAAIDLLAQRSPKQPLSDIAQQVGVKPATLVRWLSDEAFQRAIVQRARDEIRSYLPALKNLLLKKALIEGDKECLKIVINICGLLETDKPADPPKSETVSLSDEQLLERIRWFRKLYQ